MWMNRRKTYEQKLAIATGRRPGVVSIARLRHIARATEVVGPPCTVKCTNDSDSQESGLSTRPSRLLISAQHEPQDWGYQEYYIEDHIRRGEEAERLARALIVKGYLQKWPEDLSRALRFSYNGRQPRYPEPLDTPIEEMDPLKNKHTFNRVPGTSDLCANERDSGCHPIIPTAKVPKFHLLSHQYGSTGRMNVTANGRATCGEIGEQRDKSLDRVRESLRSRVWSRLEEIHIMRRVEAERAARWKELVLMSGKPPAAKL
ncbi:hypothetical protein PENSPDRAFT_671877 [Peniophora sp. CONT]|nr:hypothetical protein PENSPDRAFT_671877 [Peniophora sp. CONT]